MKKLMPLALLLASCSDPTQLTLYHGTNQEPWITVTSDRAVVTISSNKVVVSLIEASPVRTNMVILEDEVVSKIDIKPRSTP